MKKFSPGTTVCYKCGSPTFVVINYNKRNQIIMSWFNPHKAANENIIADENAIETTENFYKRKRDMELRHNNRLYEIPSGLDPESTITFGFVDKEHKKRFLDSLPTENFEAYAILNKDSPDSIN